MRCPVFNRCVARSTPTTAGMPYSRATTEPSTRSHHPADFHYQSACGEKKRRPRRVGAGAHQNLAGGQLRSIGIEDHAHRAFDHTWRHRAAHDDVLIRPGAAQSLVNRPPIAQQQARDLLAEFFALVDGPPRGDQRGPTASMSGARGRERRSRTPLAES